MYSINLCLILCFSLAFFEINAYVRVYPTPGPQVGELTQTTWTSPYHNGPHHQNGEHGRARDWRHTAEYRPQTTTSTHHMMVQIWPLFHSLLNREYTKNGKFDASNEQQLDTKAKATAYVKSKVQSKYTESVIERDGNGNGSKIITKTLESKGETNAVIEMNSNMDVISDKVMKTKSEEESKPAEIETEKTVESLKPGYHYQTEVLPKMAVYQRRSHQLRRMKREATDSGDEKDKRDKGIDNFFKKAGEFVKKAATDIAGVVQKVTKPIGEAIKKGVEDMKAKHEKRKAEREERQKKTKPQSEGTAEDNDTDQTE